MYEMEIHGWGWILHGVSLSFFFPLSLHEVVSLILSPPTNVFPSLSLVPPTPLTHMHTPSNYQPLSISSSLPTSSSLHAIPSSIMWGSMRQKESWVRLGPISLASHLSFSSISLTGLSDGLAGNHHPCIYRRILPLASFNTIAHMLKSVQAPPTLRVLTYVCVRGCSLSDVKKQLYKAEMYSFWFLWNIFY